MKISRRPVPNPEFTHQFESLRIKLETSFFLNAVVFCILCNSNVSFNISTTECSIIDRTNVIINCRRPVPNPNFTHQFESLRIKLETSGF